MESGMNKENLKVRVSFPDGVGNHETIVAELRIKWNNETKEWQSRFFEDLLEHGTAHSSFGTYELLMKNEKPEKKQESTFEKDLANAAAKHVSTHPDGEVRRMHGHYWRMFRDGALWANNRAPELEERNRELLEALEGSRSLIERMAVLLSVDPNRFAEYNEILKQYNQR